MADTVIVYDTVKTFVRETALQIPNTADLLRDAQQFYSDSFQYLLALIATAFAVIGLGVPYFISRLQNQRFRQQSDSIKARFDRLSREITKQKGEIVAQKEGIDALEQKMIDNIRAATQQMDNKVLEVEAQLRGKFGELNRQFKSDIGDLWLMNSFAEAIPVRDELFFASMALGTYVLASNKDGILRAAAKLSRIDYSKCDASSIRSYLGRFKGDVGLVARQVLADDVAALAEWENFVAKVDEVMATAEGTPSGASK